MVGQYQHEMKQKQLNESLGGVVERAVNEVGVDLNTASPSLHLIMFLELLNQLLKNY